MPERVTQPEPEREQSPPEQSEAEQEQDRQDTGKQAVPGVQPITAVHRIIWTPRFLLFFALALVLGTSADSLLASGWSTGLFGGQGQWFILGHILLALSGWMTLGIISRSRWIRIGCIFGGVCVVFLTLNVFTHLSGIDPSSPAQSYINVAACTALLGAYIGLSIEGTLLTAWDYWLFLLLPVLGSVGVTLTYLLTPQASTITTENAVAAATVMAAALIWWARPSCWQRAPGPTFLFGLVSVMQILMAMLNGSLHNFFFLQVLYPRTNTISSINNFFFAQFILLCLLLGCLRMAKSEIRN